MSRVYRTRTPAVLVRGDTKVGTGIVSSGLEGFCLWRDISSPNLKCFGVRVPFVAAAKIDG
jgi:hypothetical protein